MSEIPQSEDDSPKTLYLIRHGQTVWNMERRMQGRLDSALTKSGIEQAHVHGRLLKSRGKIEALWASPSGRTRETAHIINSYVRAPIDFAESLLERDAGDWSGLTIDDIEENYPQAWQSRLADPYHFRPPGGENIVDMLERCKRFIGTLFSANQREVALVTHQVMSRVIITHLLHLEPEETVQVNHPNELMYCFEFGPTKVEVTHFVNGQGPSAGLRRQGDDETIVTLGTTDTKTKLIDIGGTNES